jgi:hypothetical protein
VAKLFEVGKLQPALDTIVPVSAATEAYAGEIAKRRPGKLVISTSQWSGPRASATNTGQSQAGGAVQMSKRS